MIMNYVGQLYFRTGIQKKGHKKGSACLFYFCNRWLVATAAHCVYDIDGQYYYSGFTFKLPGLPEIKLNKFVISELWINKASLEHDIAFFELPPDIEKKITLEKLTPIFHKKSGEKMLLAGFPNRFLIFQKLSIVEGVGQKDKVYGSSLIGVKTKYFNGMSGGPLLLNIESKLFIVGTISFTFKSIPNTLWCASWGDEAFELLNKLKRKGNKHGFKI